MVACSRATKLTLAVCHVRIARSVVGKRYGPDKIERKDMLGSFVSNGLTQYEAESESLVQM